MSGHSKWATTKHKKAAIDAKRGKLFAKLIKNIEIVTFRRGEGDARLEGAGRVEQLGAFGGEFACRSTGHQRFGK